MADMDVTAKFRADTSQFQSAMKDVKKGVDSVDDSAKESAKGFSILQGSIATAFGTAATSAISTAASAIQSYVTSAIDLARESELTVRRLDQIAESMGIMDTVLGGSTKRLTDFAQEMQEQTAISDETIKSAQALILTFKDVASSAGDAGGVFDRVTVAALDLSAAGFGSVEGNAKSLARALQDPVKGLTMLGRQGVTFTKEQQALIKSLHESGQVLEAQDLILQAVEKQVGGTAAATATGAAKMSMAFLDLQESVGLALTPLLDTLADRIRTEVIPAFEEMWQTQGPAFIAALERLADISIDLAVPAVEALVTQFTNLATTASNVITAIADVTDAIEGPLESLTGQSDLLGKAFEFLDRTINPVTKASEALNEVALMTSKIFADSNANRHANEHKNLAGAASATARAIKESGDAAASATGPQNALNAAHERGVQAVMDMKAGYEELNGVLSTRRAKDTAIQASKDLEKSLKDNGASIKGTSDEALANRRAIDGVAASYSKWAQEAKDPELAQKRLEQGAKDLQKTLLAAGIDPESDPVYRSLKKQADQGAETVGELKKAQRDAMIAGQGVGRDFVQGIVDEAKRREGEARKAGQGIGNALEAGARDATETQSPSKVGMRIAADFVAGIAAGLKADKALAGASDLARAVVAEFEQTMQRFTATIERVKGVMSGFAGITRQAFGELSQLQSAFTGGPSSVIAMFDQITAGLNELQHSLSDINVFGRKNVQQLRQNLNAARGYIANAAQHAINLMRDIERARQELADREKEHAQRIAGLNAHFSSLEQNAKAHLDGVRAHYDGLMKAARDNIRAIQSRFKALEDGARAHIKGINDRFAALIPQLQTALRQTTAAFDQENRVLQGLIQKRDQFLGQIGGGFRSFVNNLTMEAAAATKQVVKETKRLANGITVTLEREITVGGSPQNIRKALEERLSAVRDFSTNIRSLMQRGLDPALVQDFVSAGVAGAGEIVAALAQSSAEDLAAINEVQSGLAAEVASFQDYAVEQWHAAGIAAQEAILAPVEAARDAAQMALDQANSARETELAAAQAHLESVLAMRDMELSAANAHMEALQEARDRDIANAQAAIDQIARDRAAAIDAANAEFAAEREQREAAMAEMEQTLKDHADEVQKAFDDMGARLPPKMLEHGWKFMGQFREGFIRRFPKVKGNLNARMDELVASLKRPPVILEIITVHRTVFEGGGGAPGRAMGGPVVANRAYTVGERGPELFIPNISGSIIPNHDLGNVPSMDKTRFRAGGMAMGGGGGTNISINIAAPPLTDPAEVGRQVVEAIRKYERRSGPVFISA